MARPVVLFFGMAFVALFASVHDVRAQATAPEGNDSKPTAPDTSKYADLIARSAALSEAAKHQALAAFDSGYRLWQAGDCEAAMLAFRQGLDIDPANGAANFYYGDCLKRKGDRDRAAEYLSRAAVLAAGKPEGFKAQAALQALATAPGSSAPPAEPATALAGDFATSPFDGLWQINLKQLVTGTPLHALWKLTVDGKLVHLTGDWGTMTFKSGRIDGDKIVIDWSGGFGDTFEGKLLSPTHIEGQHNTFVFSGPWSADKQ